MKLLRRNTTVFQYYKRTGEQEITVDGMHTGNYGVTYADPVEYRGMISVPAGLATDNLFGINTQYTHTLLMDDPEADIAEDGIVGWKGDEYDVKAVRKSMNVLNAALKKRTAKHVVPEPEAGEQSDENN